MSAVPFVFLGCIDLKEMLPYEARDVRELLEMIGRVPIESLFCHTAAALLHRSALPTGYPNDFAHWTGLAMGDQRLAERLAAIDPFESRSLEQMREELVATISDHLQHFPAGVAGGAGRALPLLPGAPRPRSHRSPGTHAEGVQGRARRGRPERALLPPHRGPLRLSRGRGDFAEWVAAALERPDVAERLAVIDPYSGSLERIRDRHLTVLTAALDEGSR